MSAESSLGAYLRQCREQAGLSVDAISSASRIVPQLIRALEADRFDLLPAPVYVRGFIRAYCAQVGVDPETALGRYEAHVASIPVPSLRGPTSPTPSARSAVRRWLPVVAGVTLLIALGLASTFVVVRGRQPDAVASRGSAPPATRPAASGPPDGALSRATPSAGTPGGASSRLWVSSTPSAPGGTAVSVPPAAVTAPAPGGAAPRPPSAARVLLLRTVDTTWVRVAPDGAPATEETLPPGAVREWRSTGRFRVSLGNAGAVEIALDGHPLPALGRPGEPVHTTIPDEARP